MMNVSVVTGANRGIGLELCRQLAARGKQVVAVCRQSSPDLDALGIRVEKGVDVTKPDHVAGLVSRLRDQKIELLINNAGILRFDDLDSVDAAGVREQLEVNAIAPLMLTQALRECFTTGTKLALITSRMGSIADNTSGGRYGYRMSKAALNAAGMSLARDLAPRGVAVVILHPGFVRTEMTGGQGMIDAVESAAGLLARIDELTLETSGRFLHMNGEVLPW